ncbi:Stp1/IreP family PP2C-type Ser/Thr phosphatase [Halanaerobacter jeridensis]|uniref:Protein phosphatase n=1 Tax=Halanaerobacter jeridensis TaxID=706427 RepID=A0A939BM29_9FIRM|nr:Stp1/IreP family PP2C-type Ser/Thr phosphatase [Halanaerobacter jeridensis]MBM7555515.1 protein phosphatase [Halanaerobacter jeridensis]
MNYGTVSITGKVRDKNEDNYLALDKGRLHVIAVADGMGGHKAGDVASSTAIKVVKNYDFSPHELISDVEECINIVNNKILEKSSNHPEYRGMGTTLTLGIIKNNHLVLGHIGDSRAYLYHNDFLEQITDDHSYVADLLKQGAITKEEAENHPKKNLLLRALGLERGVEVDIIEHDLAAEDVILLCSDGLTNMKSDEQIQSVLSSEELKLQEQAELLSDKANAAGGYDNITAVLYQNT